MKPGLRKRISLTRRRSRGQSMVLIALILAVLIGLVALSVDVGNTYAQQRAAQRATDAASADAMTALLSGLGCKAVRLRITTSLQAHGIANPIELTDPSITIPSGGRGYRAFFIQSDKDSSPVPASACDPGVLAGTRYVKVELTGTERTNFATLFGRNDLPVNSDSFAQRTICPPEPIALRNDAFKGWPKDGDATDTNYHDDTYKSDRPRRRFFLNTDTNAGSGQSESVNKLGQFAWLRWTESNAQPVQTLADALKPPGTVDQGFQEAPWDDEGVFGKPPDPYPNQKGIINAYDLVRGAPTMRLGGGFDQSGSITTNGGVGGDDIVAEQLQSLIKSHTAFNVVEYDNVTTGIGSKAVYRVTGFKSYMLVGYGWFESPRPPAPPALNADRGHGWYLDLVQLGKPLECAQGETQPELTNKKITLTGTVNVRALYGDTVSGRPPIDMVIVLDSSGSMNWTWDGYGSLSDTTFKDLRDNKAVEKSGRIPCAQLLYLPVGCQSSEAYKDYQQRKIYKAKQVLQSFMSDFTWGLQDRVAIVTYNGSGTPGDLTQVFPKATKALTSDIKGLAQEMIDQAGSINPGNTDPAKLYTTQGGSPGALGLRRANNLLSSSGSDRQRAVIFITDGLLNVNRAGERSKDESIDKNYDDRGGDTLPINQAITEAGLLKSDTSSKSARVFVISLGEQFVQSGLDQVASQPNRPFLVTARDDKDLRDQLNEIRGQIIDGPCDPLTEPDQPPDVDRTVRVTPGGGEQPETDTVTGQGSGGKVVVKLGGATVGDPVNIAPDGTFRIPNLLPNTNYTLSFNNPADGQGVFYKGKDGQLRNYSTIVDGAKELNVPIHDASISTTQFVYDDSSKPVILTLGIGSDVCKALTP